MLLDIVELKLIKVWVCGAEKTIKNLSENL